MKPHMQTLINLLTKKDLNALLQHYQACNESENVVQLAFIFQQGQKDLTGFEFYQQIACTFIKNKTLPAALIAQINTSDALSFFTPALQLAQNFGKTNQQQRNVLHYLLAGNQIAISNTQPPFNYLRSMMLFESNETLRDALCQRDGQNFTPVEVYLSANQNLTTLPAHQLTALLALMEIESKQQAIDNTNYNQTIQAVRTLVKNQRKTANNKLQRLVLIATYHTKAVGLIVTELNKTRSVFF